jgi:hypothetical protein
MPAVKHAPIVDLLCVSRRFKVEYEAQNKKGRSMAIRDIGRGWPTASACFKLPPVMEVEIQLLGSTHTEVSCEENWGQAVASLRGHRGWIERYTEEADHIDQFTITIFVNWGAQTEAECLKHPNYDEIAAKIDIFQNIEKVVAIDVYAYTCSGEIDGIEVYQQPQHFVRSWSREGRQSVKKDNDELEEARREKLSSILRRHRRTVTPCMRAKWDAANGSWIRSSGPHNN